MIIRYLTACGCTREESTSFFPGPEIRVPMVRQSYSSAPARNGWNFVYSYRAFEYTPDRSKEGIAVYVEKESSRCS